MNFDLKSRGHKKGLGNVTTKYNSLLGKNIPSASSKDRQNNWGKTFVIIPQISTIEITSKGEKNNKPIGKNNVHEKTIVETNKNHSHG